MLTPEQQAFLDDNAVIYRRTKILSMIHTELGDIKRIRDEVDKVRALAQVEINKLENIVENLDSEIDDLSAAEDSITSSLNDYKITPEDPAHGTGP